MDGEIKPGSMWDDRDAAHIVNVTPTVAAFMALGVLLDGIAKDVTAMIDQIGPAIEAKADEALAEKPRPSRHHAPKLSKRDIRQQNRRAQDQWRKR